MRITLISLWYIEHSVSLANALSKDNDVILILSDKSRIQDFLPVISERVKYKVIKKPRGSFIKILSEYRKILKDINSFKPQVVHVQDGNAYLALALALRDKRSYPVITSIHDPIPHVGEKWSKKIISSFLMIRISNKIIVHAHELKKQTSKLYLKSKKQIHVIMLGTHDIYKYWGKNNENADEKNILFFGRIWKYKGLEYFIKSQPIVKKSIKNAKYIIAGRGENFDKYLEMIEDSNGFKIINEYISNEKVAELYQDASVVVIPYLEATQSGVLMTAFAFNKPVIVTNVGGLPESVDYGNAGIIVPPKDSQALADAIIKILCDSELEKQLKINIEKQAQKLSYNNIAQLTKQVYLESINIYKRG